MSKQATPVTCPGCRESILETEYDHTHGVLVGLIRADPTPLTPDLETACIILGRHTYNHWHTTTGNTYLGSRSHWHQYHPGGQPTHVLPAHKCGHTLPITRISTTRTNRPTDLYDDTKHPF